MDADAALMLRFRQGDRGAFEQLFRKYTPPLVNFLARMVPERARAEELAQEVFVRVYQARERYEPRARFSTWLFGIAHNLAVNELARAYRKRERPLDEDRATRAADSGASPEEQLAAGRTLHALEAGLARLPERQRAALLLRTQEGMSYEEIAKVIGASTSGVKSLLHRARERLLELLGGEVPA
jgi:RNA polymerase sigma-70 factor (ECF subfamily)